MTEQVGPIISQERIESLDILRGFAVLGILMMNIQGIAMPAIAYNNPTSYGDFHGVNYAVWFLSHLCFDSKFITIFSMLFGAGVFLMTSNLDRRNRFPLFVFYRRLVVLYIMGLGHAYLIWFGDVLTRYAICGAILYWVRKRSPRALLIISIIGFSIFMGFTLQHGWQVYHLEGEALQRSIEEDWMPPVEIIQDFLDSFRGGIAQQMEKQIPIARWIQITNFFYQGRIFQIVSMMILGMALFKWGFLSGNFGCNVYYRFIGIGLLFGLPLTLADIYILERFNWDYRIHDVFTKPLFLLSAPFISLMWISALIIIIKKGWVRMITRCLAATGQMALSNYLMQSVLSTLFFFGHGLGWYGYLERYQQFLFVVTIWIIQLIYSLFWMKYFRFGPFEWIWRSLTYLKVQSFWR